MSRIAEDVWFLGLEGLYEIDCGNRSTRLNASAVERKLRDVCRLCLKETALVRSHIIPELVWKKTYGPDHATMSIPRQDDQPIRVLRKGPREELLCEACERVIKRYEDYFATLWFQEKLLSDQLPNGTNAIQVDGLLYTSFKLFHLSILWRASSASSPEFSEVSLSARHEARIRRMLLEGDAGRADEYALMASVLLRPGSREVVKALITAPAPKRIDRHRIYTTIYAGCAWHIVVSSHAFELSPTNRLSEEGSLLMYVLDLRHFPRVYEVLLARREQARALRGRRLSRGKHPGLTVQPGR